MNIFLLFLLFIIWRILLFIFSFIAELTTIFSPSFPLSDIFLLPSGFPRWIWSFANFDGVHYLMIANKGYWANFTQVFFPLYPLILGGFFNLLPFINEILSGLFLSNVFFLCSLFVFWKLLNIDYGKSDIIWIFLFFLYFPTSFYFGSLYSESLFFLLSILSFYFARKKRWLLSSIFAGLSTATRLVGIFLLPVLIWEWHLSKLKVKSQKSKVNNLSRLLFSIFHSPFLYIVPLGLISYMVYLHFTFGDALYFWRLQPVFGAERSGTNIVLLPQVIWRYFKILSSVSIQNPGFITASSELFFTIVSLILISIGIKLKIRISYLLYSFLLVLLPTFTGTLSSMPRYIIVAFPIYIVLGRIRNREVKIFLLVLSFIFLVYFTLIFTSGQWVA